MSMLLAKVDWDRLTNCLLRRLDGEVDEPLRAELAALEGSPLLAWPAAVALAVAVEVAPFRHVAATISECSALDFGDQMLVLAWLQSACRELVGRAARQTTAAAHATRAEPGRSLEVDGMPAETLPGWLRALAKDVAFRRGLAIAYDGDKPRTGYYDTTTRTIFLDPSRGTFGPVEWVLAHELGHVLDPELGHRALGIDDEHYADALARLLIEHRPRTIAEAQPLIEQAREQVPSDTPTGDLPTDPMLQVLTLLGLTKGSTA